MGTPKGCNPAGQAASADSATYHYVLDVGPLEQMYTQQQNQANHPTTGEVMIGGEMSMASGPDARHMEVHICYLSNGDVVDASTPPSLTLTDATTGNSQDVPVSTMEGVTEGEADLHYGNNVSITPGDHYEVTVVLKGEQVTMSFTGS
ncbi:MAG: hypothetical protein ACRDYC_03690 [Acidimicrobiales bacterium]